MESGKRNWIEYHPLTSVADGSPIEFEISGSGEDYIDFGNSMLYVQAKIVQPNGTDLGAAANTAPVNVFLHSLFSQVDIQLNGTLITSSTNTYPYRAILETLSYGEDAKKTQVTSGLYYKDVAGQMDTVALRAGDDVVPNEGLVKRSQHTNQSRVVDMMGRLHADIFFQDRYMLNEVNVKIKLVRSKDAFCVMSEADCRVVIIKATMFVRKSSCRRRYSWHMLRPWKTVRQNILLDALYARRLPCRMVFETSSTRNCFPVNYRLASSSG